MTTAAIRATAAVYGTGTELAMNARRRGRGGRPS